jgi:long-chain fatty acid transport protein
MTTLSRLLLLAGGLGLAQPAWAEGGYYAGTLGTQATGRGGAFVARADDVTAVSYNPAGLANLRGTVLQFGNQFSYNRYDFTRAPTPIYRENQDPLTVTFPKVSNQAPWQAADPFLGVASNLGLKDWGFAVAAFAPSGIAKLQFPMAPQDRAQDSGQRYLMVSRESMILNYTASAAWKYADRFGLGVTLQWIHVPRLSYSLVIDGSTFPAAANPVSSDMDILSTVSGSSRFTFNAIVGLWFRAKPWLDLGVSGQVVPSDITVKSRLAVEPRGDLVGSIKLTRDGVLADDVTLTLPLPMIFRGGARYRHLDGDREVFDVELDVDYTTWSRVGRLGIDANNLQAAAQSNVLTINVISIEKQWRDSLGIRLGGDYAALPGRLTLRAGAYYESPVSDAAYFNVDFATGAQLGGAVGASLFFGGVELAAAYAVRVQPTVTTTEAEARVYQQVPGSRCKPPYTDAATCNANYRGQPGPVANAGTYSAASHFASLSAIYRL